MTAQEFLESYFAKRQEHEMLWEATWQRELRGFFGEYFLERRAEADKNWAIMPTIVEKVWEDDDTVSFIVEAEGHFTKRYYVEQANGAFLIDRVMVRCEICDGDGKIMEEECELCGGRGWDDWID